MFRGATEGNIEIRGEQKELFPRDQSLSDLLYSTKTKTCHGNDNGGRRSTFAGNRSDVIDLELLPAQRLLAGNSFIVRCHVTSK